MISLLQRALCTSSITYSFVFVAAVFFAWFPPADESPVRPFAGVTTKLTEPLLAPFRRVMRPAQVGSVQIDYTILIFMFLFGTLIPGILGCYRLI